MNELYQVRHWDENYENAKSRERDSRTWASMPNKQNGMGLCKTLTQKDGLALYGFWSLLIGALSQQRKPRGGWLTHDGYRTGTPWTPADLALKFRRSEAEMKRGLSWFSSINIGWIAIVASDVPAECPPDTLDVPAECPKRREEEREKSASEKSQQPDQEWIKSLSSNAAFEGLDIKREVAKCATWCATNKRTFSRRRIVNWLNRAEKPIQRGATNTATIKATKSYQELVKEAQNGL